MAPRDIREFYSSSVGLFTASEPREVRLYLVQQSVANEANKVRRWSVSFRAPVTVSGILTPDATHLQLGSRLEVAKGPFLDLLFAKVSVDQSGSVDGVEVLDALDSEAAAWFLDFARHQLAFYPAADGDVPQPGQAFVMVRVVLSGKAFRNRRIHLECHRGSSRT